MTTTPSVPGRRLMLCLAALIAGFLLSSCGSSDTVKNLTAEERFALGKEKFADGDYLEAINEFQMVKLQFPASSVSDDAQYYLAECHFAKEEFLLASEEYQSLKRLMASSPYVPQAQYKIAMCYYRLSPRATLDQLYGKKAIEEFQTFIEDYRGDTLVPAAEAKIKELNTRLAEKIYDSAQMYERLEYNRSATIYYDMVIEEYHDTEFAEPALLRKAHVLVARKKYDDARAELEKFLTKYPNSQRRSEAESLRASIAPGTAPDSSGSHHP